MPEPLSPKIGFGMNRHRLAVFHGHVLDDVLVGLNLIGHLQQFGEDHVDLGLAGGADLVMLDLDLHATGFEGDDHLRT